MSKGSDDINIAYLDKLTEAVIDMTSKLDKISPSYGSNGQLEQTLRTIAKSVNNGDTTLKQMLREAANTQRNIRSVEYGVESTAKYNKTVNMFVKMLEEKLGNSKIDDVLIKKITTAFENLDVTAILESEKIGQRGGKGAPLKNVMDNEKLNKVNEDLAKRIGLKMDEAQYKLMAFFQEQEQKRDKKTASFVNDLIEGLEKSKWVGGALRDTFRLIGLLGANWLSQFGQLGRILGGAFYVAMELAGPTIVKLLIQGMGKLLMNLPSLIGKLGGVGKGIWGVALNASMKAGGPLADFVTAPAGQRLAAGGRLAGAGLVAGAAIAGGGWAISQGVDSWKQGRKGNAAALGLGGVGLIAGGIAAVVAGLSAPITVPLLAISAAVVGIAALWKYHSETIKKWAAKFGSFVNKVIDFMALWNPIFKAIQWIRDNAPWGEKSRRAQSNPLSSTVSIFGTGAKGASAHLLEGKTDKTGHLDISKMSAEDWKTADSLAAEYDLSTGAIINLGKMTQRRAAEAIKADIEAKGEKSYYEIADKSLVDKSQFLTDAADAENVYLVRGTSARVRSDLDKLQSMGYDTSHAKITAGIGTLGSSEFMSPHTYKDSATGHFGTTSSVDVGYIYKNGRRADYSEYSKYLDRMAYGQSEGDHDHWAYGKFKYMNDRIKEHKEEEAKIKALSVTESMNIAGNILKTVNPQEYERLINNPLKPKEGKLLEDYKKALEKEGIIQDTSLVGNPYVKVSPDGNQHVITDKSGNIMYNQLFLLNQVPTIANVGVN